MAAKDRFMSMFKSKSIGDNPVTGIKQYTRIRTLGQGSYGTVLLAVDTKTREKVSSVTFLDGKNIFGSLDGAIATLSTPDRGQVLLRLAAD